MLRYLVHEVVLAIHESLPKIQVPPGRINPRLPDHTSGFPTRIQLRLGRYEYARRIDLVRSWLCIRCTTVVGVLRIVLFEWGVNDAEDLQAGLIECDRWRSGLMVCVVGERSSNRTTDERSPGEFGRAAP